MDRITFRITEDHLKLLGRMYIGWDDCEFGAPAVDCKRPYGNSDVYGDIAEILGIEPDGDSEFSDADRERMHTLHSEMRRVLQIGVRVGYFKVGDYHADRYSQDWQPTEGS